MQAISQDVLFYLTTQDLIYVLYIVYLKHFFHDIGSKKGLSYILLHNIAFKHIRLPAEPFFPSVMTF